MASLLADARVGKCSERLRSALLLRGRREINSAAVKAVFNPVVFLLAFRSLQPFSEYPARLAQECPISTQEPGVTIGLAPVENSKTQPTYFHADLTKKGFVPVLVVIEKRNGSRQLYLR
jgi:hypothetical protein